jgi:CRISPR-associated exonuclease Cas4
MNPIAATETEPFTFRVIDLKQYVYCPRVAYYHLVLPDVRPITYNMEHGLESHVQAEGRERRRSLVAYGLKEGERRFSVPLWSAELGLSGELDMLIETETERIPVDYKDSEKIGEHFKLQLMAYGRLLEETEGPTARPVRRGFLYLIPLRKAVEVKFTPRLRQELAGALASIQAMAARQLMPGPTDRTRRCVDCEFRRFCNDVG